MCCLVWKGWTSSSSSVLGAQQELQHGVQQFLSDHFYTNTTLHEPLYLRIVDLLNRAYPAQLLDLTVNV